MVVETVSFVVEYPDGSNFKATTTVSSLKHDNEDILKQIFEQAKRDVNVWLKHYGDKN